MLTNWRRVTHICVSKFTIIGTDIGSAPVRHQAIIWTNVELMLIRPMGNRSRNSYIFFQENASEYVVCEMAAMLSRPQCFN